MNINIPYLICSVLSFVPAIVLHEVAHGFAAYKLGDPTAKNQGRLTLNPIKHIDTFGTVILPGMLMLLGGPVFGYAKPVPYDPRYFKDKRKGDLIVGLAGPAANFVMALFGAFLAWILYPTMPTLLQISPYFFYLDFFLALFVLINLFLMFFNLLPIPPLDGSSIFAVLLPERYLPKYYQIQRYALPIFFLIVFGLPYLFGMFGIDFNLIQEYLDVTAYNIARMILPAGFV